MRFKALNNDLRYIDITDLPCFCKIKPEVSHQDTIGRYILTAHHDRYYYKINGIYLGAWDIEDNFYILVKGVMYKTQVNYFEIFSPNHQATHTIETLVL